MLHSRLSRLVLILSVALLMATPACARSRAVHHSPPGPVVIDVMALYTGDAAASNGGAVMMEQKIRTAVDGLNGDLVRTGIFDLQFRLTSVGEAPAEVTSQNFYFDAAVAALRDAARADLVSLWSTSNEGFGLLPDRNNPSPVTGFHHIPSNQDWDSHLLAHEIGHNLGLLHEDGICRTATPAVRDIMSKCEGETILAPLYRAFTNPNISVGGLPFGGPQNAASIIRMMASRVAAYRLD